MGSDFSVNPEIDDTGEFQRQQSAFRDSGARPEPGRYHLYVTYACPWASRIIIARKLKGLEELLPMTVVDPIRDARGWRFLPGDPDPVNGFAFLAEAYELSSPGFSDRVTVPVLWDKQENRIVNNESSELLRMLNDWSSEGPDLYPEAYRAEIDAINDRVYDGLNNGVYRAGFATTQKAYERRVAVVFETLAWMSTLLQERRYLAGSPQPTEADWRAFVTLVRFDAVYVGHFKCNIHRIADDPVLEGYLRDLYQHPGIAETVNLDHIKRHYYLTHPMIDPTGIVPVGPELQLDGPHDRERLG